MLWHTHALVHYLAPPPLTEAQSYQSPPQRWERWDAADSPRSTPLSALTHIFTISLWPDRRGLIHQKPRTGLLLLWAIERAGWAVKVSLPARARTVPWGYPPAVTYPKGNITNCHICVMCWLIPVRGRIILHFPPNECAPGLLSEIKWCCFLMNSWEDLQIYFDSCVSYVWGRSFVRREENSNDVKAEMFAESSLIVHFAYIWMCFTKLLRPMAAVFSFYNCHVLLFVCCFCVELFLSAALGDLALSIWFSWSTDQWDSGLHALICVQPKSPH